MGRRPAKVARISIKCPRGDKQLWEAAATADGMGLSPWIVNQCRQQQQQKDNASYTARAVCLALGVPFPNGFDHPHRPFSTETDGALAAHRRRLSSENFGESESEKKGGEEGEAARARGPEFGVGSESPKNLARRENLGEVGEGEVWPGTNGVEVRAVRDGGVDEFPRGHLTGGGGDPLGLRERIGAELGWPALAGENRAKILTGIGQRIHGLIGAFDLRPSEAYPLLSLLFTRVRLKEEIGSEALPAMRKELERSFAGSELSAFEGVNLMGMFLMWIRKNPDAARSVNAKIPAVPSAPSASNDRKVSANGKSGGSALDDRGARAPAGSVGRWRVARDRALAGKRTPRPPLVRSGGSAAGIRELRDRDDQSPVGLLRETKRAGDELVGNQAVPVSRESGDAASRAAALPDSHAYLELDEDDDGVEEGREEEEEIPLCPRCQAILPPEMVCRSAVCQQRAIDEQSAMRDTAAPVKPRKAPPRPNAGLTGSPVQMAAPEDSKRKTAVEKFRNRFVKPKEVKEGA